jgi:membrane protease YdiL (CAAX protease family)
MGDKRDRHSHLLAADALSYPLHFRPRMIPLAAALTFVLVVWLTIVYLNERHGLLSSDYFPSPAMKWGAYVWLGAFMLVLAALVTGAALRPATARDLTQMPFYSLFALHAILIIFLVGWWAFSGRPPLREFLQIRHERPLEVLSVGTAVGVGGWVVTLMTALVVALILQAIGLLQEPPGTPPMIGWMAALPLWKKATIVLSAMTVEEFFFRSFLQKRIGLLASTLLFGLAHFTYGQPLLLIGVTVISLIIGLTFWRTKNVLPGIIAHGVFDAIQLFVIVPFAVRMTGGA